MAESVNLQEIHDTLVSLAFEAGRMILNANPNDISTGTKMNCTFCPLRLPSPPPNRVLNWLGYPRN